MIRLYRTVITIVAAMAVALPSARAIAQAPVLLRVLGESPATKASVKVDSTATVKSRAAQPDVIALDEIGRHHLSTGAKTRFVIDLFPGLDLEAEVLAAETRAQGSTLFARLTDVELGSAVFTIEGGVLTATVDFPGGSYVVTPQPGGHYMIAQKAAQLFPPELQPRATFPVFRNANPFAPADAIQSVPQDSGRLIDVMIVWTPSAEAGAGGLVAMQSLAQASVDSANMAYLNSGIAQRLRLVHRQQVAYTERTNCPPGGTIFECALDDVTYAGDGQLENVHTLRDAHGADLVALLIENGGGSACGIAWLPTTFSPDQGFSVTAHTCAVGNKSFAHEIGHNLGAHHDPANASSDGPKAFNRGYISPGLNWRTVMAYPGGCGNCTRLSYFSNPKVAYGGTAMGTAGVSNNAHVLNFSAKAVAAYRPTSALHPVPQRFVDVPVNHLFHGHIEFFAQAGISTGCALGQFCPDAPTSRRAMAAFIERTTRASNWVPATNTTAFADVVDGSQFAGEIEAMRTDAITLGCTATTYCPESAVTRGQMAVFVLRARCGAGYVPNPPGTPTFADVPLSHPFVAYIQKMHSLGITTGCATGPLRYCPDAPVTRGQMAAFVERAHPFVTPSEACSL